MKRSMITIALTAAVSAAFVLCSGVSADAGNVSAAQKLEAAKQSYLASIRSEALRTRSKTPETINAGSPSQWLTRVEAKNVNMVTNRTENGTQQSLNINGSSYFVADETYAWTLQQNLNLRFAVDPITNRKVDKAKAALFADASGRVFYFESEKSYEEFLALGAPTTDTVFGYSEPR